MYLQKEINKKLWKKTYFLLATCQPLTKKQDTDPNPDPLISGTRIRIRTRTSWISSTASEHHANNSFSLAIQM